MFQIFIFFCNANLILRKFSAPEGDFLQCFCPVLSWSRGLGSVNQVVIRAGKVVRRSWQVVRRSGQVVRRQVDDHFLII